MLRSDNSTLTRIAARIIGYRRIDASSDLLHLLPESHPDALPTLIWALGRLRVSEARASLYPFLDHDDTSTRAAAALALLRMGEQQVVQHCLALAPSQPWALSWLAWVAVVLTSLYPSLSPRGILLLLSPCLPSGC